MRGCTHPQRRRQLSHHAGRSEAKPHWYCGSRGRGFKSRRPDKKEVLNCGNVDFISRLVDSLASDPSETPHFRGSRRRDRSFPLRLRIKPDGSERCRSARPRGPATRGVARRAGAKRHETLAAGASRGQSLDRAAAALHHTVRSPPRRMVLPRRTVSVGRVYPRRGC
jgi:hypothetical protein